MYALHVLPVLPMVVAFVTFLLYCPNGKSNSNLRERQVDSVDDCESLSSDLLPSKISLISGNSFSNASISLG